MTNLKKKEWKPGSQKRNIAELGDEPYRQLFEYRAKEIVSDNNHDLWGTIRGVPKACDEVRGYEKNRKGNANTWWWNRG